MDRLQQLLHDKGALITDIEILSAQVKGLQDRLGPINQELGKLLQERQTVANAPAAVREDPVA